MVTRRLFETLWPGTTREHLESLPSLSDFSPDHQNNHTMETLASGASAASKLIRLVRHICMTFKFRPLICEMAYLSDPVQTHSMLGIKLRSISAATTDCRPLIFSPLPQHRPPYYRAFTHMLAGDSAGQSEPIAGHPNLWGVWKDQARVGHVRFPASSMPITAPRLSRKLPPDDRLTPVKDERSIFEIVDYQLTAEQTFARFVRFFLEEAMSEAEARPELVAAYRLVRGSTFLGVPLVRSETKADPATIAALNSLGFSTTRGVVLLLFLDPIQPDSKQQRSPPTLDDDVDRLARNLHLLLAEMALKEAAEQAQKQAAIIKLQGDIVHDASNILLTIQPTTFSTIFAHHRTRFDSGDWAYWITDARLERQRGKEKRLLSGISNYTKRVNLARQTLGLIELRLRGHDRGKYLRTKYQQSGKSVGLLDAVINEAASMLEEYSEKEFIPKLSLQVATDITQRIQIPPGYLASEYIVPLVFEILLNAARHGSQHDGCVVVSICSHKMQYATDTWAVVVEFGNSVEGHPPKAVAGRQILENLHIEHECRVGGYTQRLFFGPIDVETVAGAERVPLFVAEE